MSSASIRSSSGCATCGRPACGARSARSRTARSAPRRCSQKARAHTLWTERAARKRAYDAAHPGKHYGVGFGCIQRRFGEGAEAAFAKVELAPDGRITLSHSGTEIGTGTSSGQAVACARWLGRPADKLDLAVTEWPDLPVEASGDPFAMSQADQDRLAKNPRWSPVAASASTASNSSYYFTHVTREAARIVFLHGLWPAATAIWAAQRTSARGDARSGAAGATAC